MAEEKSAPKKAPAKDAAAAAPAVEKQPKAAKAPAAKKDASAPEAGAPVAAPVSDKPVELIGGVAKQPTAEDLLKEELGTIKVRKAKGSKNVTSGVVNVLASSTTRLFRSPTPRDRSLPGPALVSATSAVRVSPLPTRAGCRSGRRPATPWPTA